jgi:hypothetical protein
MSEEGGIGATTFVDCSVHHVQNLHSTLAGCRLRVSVSCPELSTDVVAGDLQVPLDLAAVLVPVSPVGGADKGLVVSGCRGVLAVTSKPSEGTLQRALSHSALSLTRAISLGRVEDIRLKVTIVHVGAGGLTEPVSSGFVSVSLSKLMLQDKVCGFRVATGVGHVGLMLSVSESDKEGFRRRLHAYLMRYGGQSAEATAAKVAQVMQMDKASEAFVFAQLRFKFEGTTPLPRLEAFAELYHIDADSVRAVAAKWQRHETRLLSLLCMAFGPESGDINILSRVTDYALAHDLDIHETLLWLAEQHGHGAGARGLSEERLEEKAETVYFATPEARDAAMQTLVAKYGAENPPTGYLFRSVGASPRLELTKAASSLSLSFGSASAIATPTPHDSQATSAVWRDSVTAVPTVITVTATVPHEARTVSSNRSSALNATQRSPTNAKGPAFPQERAAPTPADAESSDDERRQRTTLARKLTVTSKVMAVPSPKSSPTPQAPTPATAAKGDAPSRVATPSTTKPVVVPAVLSSDSDSRSTSRESEAGKKPQKKLQHATWNPFAKKAKRTGAALLDTPSGSASSDSEKEQDAPQAAPAALAAPRAGPPATVATSSPTTAAAAAATAVSLRDMSSTAREPSPLPPTEPPKTMPQAQLDVPRRDETPQDAAAAASQSQLVLPSASMPTVLHNANSVSGSMTMLSPEQRRRRAAAMRHVPTYTHDESVQVDIGKAAPVIVAIPCGVSAAASNVAAEASTGEAVWAALRQACADFAVPDAFVWTADEARLRTFFGHPRVAVRFASVESRCRAAHPRSADAADAVANVFAAFRKATLQFATTLRPCLKEDAAVGPIWASFLAELRTPTNELVGGCEPTFVCGFAMAVNNDILRDSYDRHCSLQRAHGNGDRGHTEVRRCFLWCTDVATAVEAATFGVPATTRCPFLFHSPAELRAMVATLSTKPVNTATPTAATSSRLAGNTVLGESPPVVWRPLMEEASAKARGPNPAAWNTGQQSTLVSGAVVACDVYVGNAYRTVMATVPKSVSLRAELDEPFAWTGSQEDPMTGPWHNRSGAVYDSALLRHGVQGEALAVFSPQQVCVRAILAGHWSTESNGPQPLSGARANDPDGNASFHHSRSMTDPTGASRSSSPWDTPRVASSARTDLPRQQLPLPKVANAERGVGPSNPAPTTIRLTGAPRPGTWAHSAGEIVTTDRTGTVTSADADVGAKAVRADIAKGWQVFASGNVRDAERLWLGAASAGVRGTPTFGAEHESLSAAERCARLEAHGVALEAAERDPQAAADAYRLALEADPDCAVVRFRLGSLLETAFHEHLAALEMFERAAALGDTAAVRRARLLKQRLQIAQ